MKRLDPNKLFTEYRKGVTATEPVIPRRYTLTHSDITADLFLTIGPDYAYDKISEIRDEVLGEWVKEGYRFYFYTYLYISGEENKEASVIRNYIFRRELPLALEAIRHGDARFFEAHKELDYAPIIVFFRSADPVYNKTETWGTFTDYQ